ncbi:plasmid stabilization protein [Candidatus Azambacteria bacterium]|nr:plasmid stabilization protein [Candidatus Azambacteria bacterium]
MRHLISAGSFDKKLHRFLLNHPDLKNKTKGTLGLLSKDVFSASLETHKLSGSLKMFYGASINNSYRIVFIFDTENVFLLNIGSHDEVY